MKIPGKSRRLTVWSVVRAVLTLMVLLALAWAWDTYRRP